MPTLVSLVFLRGSRSRISRKSARGECKRAGPLHSYSRPSRRLFLVHFGSGATSAMWAFSGGKRKSHNLRRIATIGVVNRGWMGPAMWRLDRFEEVASNETAIEEVVIGRAVSQCHDDGIPQRPWSQLLKPRVSWLSEPSVRMAVVPDPSCRHLAYCSPPASNRTPFGNAVALARAADQAAAIDDSDVAAFVADETGPLQGAGRSRDAGPLHADHHRQEFLRE